MVTRDITPELFQPKFAPRLRRVGEAAILMAVPEAAINKDSNALTSKYEIRFSKDRYTTTPAVNAGDFEKFDHP